VSDPFFESPRPLVFAHRGGAALAPENTFAAFDQGLSLGADGLEIDVRLSRDAVVVVHHDETIERTTNRGGRVSDWDADELWKTDAGYRFGNQDTWPFRGLGHGVPRLHWVLSRYPGTRIIIDLKDDTAELARATIDVLRTANAFDRVCLGSFGRRPLQTVRQLAPSVATSASKEEVRWALYRSWVGWPASAPAYRGYQVPEFAGRRRVVSPRFISACHRAGLRVQVWTVDREDEARRFLRWGVDGLITDRPDIIVPLCRSQH
jgi:glycerophosphoryl diester phosphodiesterase